MLLAKYSEPMLKGENARRRMVRILRGNISAALKNSGAMEVKIRSEGGIFIISADDEPRLIAPLLRVFGVDSVSACEETEPEMAKLRAKCAEASAGFAPGSTFAIRAKRSSESRPPSPQIGAECGEAVLDAHPEKRLKVRLGSPENELFVDMREKSAFVCAKPIQGPGGLPAGAEGVAGCIVRDSTFSPLAAWMMAKRGLSPFLLSPRGGPHAREVASRLAPWFAGKEPEIIFYDSEESICVTAEKAGASALVGGELWDEAQGRLHQFQGCGLPLFTPLIGLSRKSALMLAEKAGLAGNGAVK